MKKWKVVQKVEKSIFVKLLLMFMSVSLVTLIIIYLVLFYLIRAPDRELQFRLNNRTNYGEMLVREIGDPPNLGTASRISQQYGISIAIDGKTLSFKSDPSIPSIEEVQSQALRIFHIRDASTGDVWGTIYLVIKRAGYRYLFLFPYDPFFRLRPRLTSTILTIVLLLFLATFLFTRRLLRPLKPLHNGVREVSHGNLEYRISVENRDEFGDLARSFNRMSERIRQMIEAKEQLILAVSHELRSPLTRIFVALEVGDSEEIIRRNLVEMDGMISELLESARLASTNGALKLEKTDLTRLLTEVASKYKDDIPGVRLLPLPQGIELQIDPARIQTVFKNIIENALKYSPKDRKPVEISIRRVPGFIEVLVEDFGIGILEKEKALVFEPFYRVEKSRSKDSGGYGLGLSLCKKIMTAHAGDLRLESELHLGTRVFIVFPA